MKRLIVPGLLLIVLGGGSYVYHDATTPYQTLPAVRVTAVQAAAAERKLDALWSPGGGPKTSGKPVPITESFTDGELTSLASQKLHGHSLALDGLVVHSTAHGTIESQATAHWGGQSLPLYLVAVVQVVNGNELQLRIVQSKTGRLNVPQALTDQINNLVEQNLNSGSAHLDEVTVLVTDGLLTISVIAKPV